MSRVSTGIICKSATRSRASSQWSCTAPCVAGARLCGRRLNGWSSSSPIHPVIPARRTFQVVIAEFLDLASLMANQLGLRNGKTGLLGNGHRVGSFGFELLLQGTVLAHGFEELLKIFLGHDAVAGFSLGKVDSSAGALGYRAREGGEDCIRRSAKSWREGDGTIPSLTHEGSTIRPRSMRARGTRGGRPTFCSGVAGSPLPKRQAGLRIHRPHLQGPSRSEKSRRGARVTLSTGGLPSAPELPAGSMRTQ